MEHPDVTDHTHPADTTDLVTLLHERGQRVTPQRLVVLRELRRRQRHCTADEIRRSISAELPGMSAPTVYAALDLLVGLGLARRIDVGAGAALYDGRTDPHQHAVCRHCGRVDDLDGDVDLAAVNAACARSGFVPGTAEIVVPGLCAACAAPGS